MAAPSSQQCQELAKALGLDSSTPYETLIQQVGGLKQRVRCVEKMGDWRHLLTEGVATDCAIQVHNTNDATASSPPTASRVKRAMTTHGAGEAGASSSGGAAAAHTIKAHSVILGSRSEYFRAVLMRGQWAESQDKTIEVELPSEEALETFKLLVELSHGVTYTKRPSDTDGHSTTFDPNTIVQLISVANMFEFLSCIEMCCEELCGMEGWDADMALSLIDALVSLADTHESVRRLAEKAVEKVGLLEDLWQQGPWCVYYGNDVNGVKKANIDRIKVLTSVDALVYLLKSDKLAMHSENTTFTLVHYWLNTREGWDEVKKQSTFDTIMDSQALRFERMDPTYLALYALRTPWLSGHKMATKVVQRAFQGGLGGTWADDEKAALPKSRAKVQGSQSNIREAVVTKEEFARMKVKDAHYCFIGLAAGFPLTLTISSVDVVPGPAFGMFVGWGTGGLAVAAKGGSCLRGALTMRFRIIASPMKVESTISPMKFREDEPRGRNYYFGKSWDEFMAEGSPYFDAEGIMKVTVEMTITKP